MQTLQKALIILIFLLFSFSVLYAQHDPDSLIKIRQREIDKIKAQQDSLYKKWLNKEQEKLRIFKEEQDSAFVEFLKKEWRAFELFKGLEPDEKPKPDTIPKTIPKDIPKGMILEPSKTIKDIRVPEPPLIKESESIERFIKKFIKQEEQISFSYFDALLQINYDKAISKAKLENPINEIQISDFWADLSHSNYEDLLNQSKLLKEQMKLNDWGFCLLLHKIGEALYAEFENKRILFVWFMLLKAHYDAKVGYNESELYLLLPSKHTIYGVQYLIMNDKNYYVVTFDTLHKKTKSVFTYDRNYPEAENLIALNIENAPLIRQAFEEKQLKFNYGNQEFDVSLKLKIDAIDFYSNYPQTNYEVYFDASLSPEARYSLLCELKPIIEGKSEVEAVNMLLRFVQTAFEYQNDVIKFGREKPFFAEETLFYPYSDCEDRSVLFAYLVRNLLGLEVIGLDYPGHVAAAVKFSTNVNGDYVEHNGEKYIICDATYINANLGECIPRFKNFEPKVIAIGNSH